MCTHGFEGASHLGSHTNLLTDLSGAGGKASTGTVDVIGVPTVNPARVGPVITLAKAQKSVIILLCSTSSQAREIRKRHVLPPGALCLVVPPGYSHPLLGFERWDLEKHTDIAVKRNIVLLLARLCGWGTIFYVDDDIRDLMPALVAWGAGIVKEHPIVGFQVFEFPDNSIVCHANRASGGNQSTFIGGEALMVDSRRVETYFPPIFNEDWLFMYDAVAAGLVAIAGSLRQLPYDPFSRSAAREEFGELIAEGLVRALHFGWDVSKRDFWEDAIRKRSLFIEEIAGRLHASARGKDAGVPDRDRMLLCLAEAKKRLLEITPEHCLSFHRTWCENKEIWRQQLLTLPTSLTPQQAVDYLGLSSV